MKPLGSISIGHTHFFFNSFSSSSSFSAKLFCYSRFYLLNFFRFRYHSRQMSYTTRSRYRCSHWQMNGIFSTKYFGKTPKCAINYFECRFNSYKQTELYKKNLKKINTTTQMRFECWILSECTSEMFRFVFDAFKRATTHFKLTTNYERFLCAVVALWPAGLVRSTPNVEYTTTTNSNRNHNRIVPETQSRSLMGTFHSAWMACRGLEFVQFTSSAYFYVR